MTNLIGVVEKVECIEKGRWWRFLGAFEVDF